MRTTEPASVLDCVSWLPGLPALRMFAVDHQLPRPDGRSQRRRGSRRGCVEPGRSPVPSYHSVRRARTSASTSMSCIVAGTRRGCLSICATNRIGATRCRRRSAAPTIAQLVRGTSPRHGAVSRARLWLRYGRTAGSAPAPWPAVLSSASRTADRSRARPCAQSIRVVDELVGSFPAAASPIASSEHRLWALRMQPAQRDRSGSCAPDEIPAGRPSRGARRWTSGRPAHRSNDPSGRHE